MKNFFFVPRMLVPAKERQNWSVIACDRYQNERSYWENQASARGAIPSALNLIFPEVYRGEDDEERYARIREEAYTALENDYLEKLARGFILLERTSAGEVRRGIVAAIDLECFAEGGSEGQVRCSKRAQKSAIEHYLKLREKSPVEMPHVVIAYTDPKNRTLNALFKGDLEETYRYKIDGVELTGYFLPEEDAEEVSRELLLRSEGFFVVEGVAAAEAAKLHWKKVKEGLTKGEMGRHPARFMLAEFNNLCDDAVSVRPVHRLIKETDAEAFCDYFAKQFRCERRDGLLVPNVPFSAESVEKIDEAIARFIKADGGKCVCIHDEERLKKFAISSDAVGVLMPCPKKSQLIKELNAGATYPENSFCIGGEKGARYYVEAREISYD